MKADSLALRPVLFDQATGQKLNERALIAKDTRLEYSLATGDSTIPLPGQGNPMNPIRNIRPTMPTRGNVGNEKLPEGYKCNRCKLAGHHIRNCPENGNAMFAPHLARGIPKA